MFSMQTVQFRRWDQRKDNPQLNRARYTEKADNTQTSPDKHVSVNRGRLSQIEPRHRESTI